MASANDKMHFRAIAEGMEELNREATRRAAARSPGENIEIAFRLTRAATRGVSAWALARPEDEVSPASLWRELQLRRSAHG